MLNFLTELIGHFHPVIVHLPIGILLVAAFFHVLTLSAKYQALRPAVSLSLLIGMISAAIACLTGWLLSLTGDYDGDATANHQWLGIATAIVSCVAYLAGRKRSRYSSWTVGMMVLLLTVTGHLGGSLTHGEGYLTAAFADYPAEGEIEPIANVQEALIYDDIIRPLLAARCYSCHSNRKQKGRLRLDEIDFILKGGKSGAAIVPGDASAGELVHRIFLDEENEDHMPPKEKPQLTAAQKDLIKWWVTSGAPFDKKMRDMDQASGVSQVLAALGADAEMNPVAAVPNEPVEAAPAGAVEALRKAGAVVVPVAQNSNYLSVNFVNVEASNDSVMIILPAIGKQLVWLKTGTYAVDDEALKTIGMVGTITRLQIGKLKGSANGLEHLSNLKNLQYLSVAGAKLTKENLRFLNALTSLQTLYLFGSKIPAQDFADLRNSLPDTRIDTGAYVVPTLASDTTEVTAATQ